MRLRAATLILLCGSLSLFRQQTRRAYAERTVPGHPSVQAAGCPAGVVDPPADVSAPTDFVDLERTTCFGSCPAYTVQVRADGQISWQGKASVHTAAPASDRVKPEEARALIEKFRAGGFWRLCETYSRSATDMPWALTTVRLAGQEKRVSLGDESAIGWLRDLNYEIDALAGTHRWIHGDPRMESIVGYLGADAHGPKPGLTPLMQASGRGDIAQVQSQLAAKADPNAQDASGWTALIYASELMRPDVIRILLDAGADPNLRSYRGQSAIMAASRALYAPEEKVSKLVAAGGDINAQDVDGQTALMMVIHQFERPNMVSLLLSLGARTDLRDRNALNVFDHLDVEAKRRPTQQANYEKLRKALESR